MKLFHIKRKLDLWLRAAGIANRSSQSDGLVGDARTTTFSPLPDSKVVSQKSAPTSVAPKTRERRGNTSRVIEWRRRVLIRKGASMQAAMLARSDVGSLAMLDACGVVVYWGERSLAGTTSEPPINVLKHHVSQFYLPEDVARSVPLLHLRNAAAAGSSTQSGWRKRPDGSAFWATTVIEALSLRGGSLQGFSHIVRESTDQWLNENAESVRSLQQREAEGLWQPRDSAYGSDSARAQ